jgi:hypothetical protein
MLQPRLAQDGRGAHRACFGQFTAVVVNGRLGKGLCVTFDKYLREFEVGT